MDSPNNSAFASGDASNRIGGASTAQRGVGGGLYAAELQGRNSNSFMSRPGTPAAA
jgi:hypothetical protein